MELTVRRTVKEAVIKNRKWPIELSDKELQQIGIGKRKWAEILTGRARLEAETLYKIAVVLKVYDIREFFVTEN